MFVIQNESHERQQERSKLDSKLKFFNLIVASMFFFCHVAKIANCLFIIEIAVSVRLKKFLDRIESVEIFFVSEKKNLPLFSETTKYGGEVFLCEKLGKFRAFRIYSV